MTMKDVDMVNGTVFIKNGKNHKDRLLPVNPQLIASDNNGIYRHYLRTRIKSPCNT